MGTSGFMTDLSSKGHGPLISSEDDVDFAIVY
jgi:hypothetical protein